MIVSNINEFKKQLLKYVDSSNLSIIRTSKRTKIEELNDDGKGEVYVNVVSNDIIQIILSPKIAIGKNKNNNDGLLLSIDFSKKSINIYIFELKKQLRFNKLEKATKQLYNAYIFIKYLNLEDCFDINYYFYIATKENNLKKDYEDIKVLTPYQIKLFKSVYENKTKIPIMQTFCKYKEFDFKLLNFGEIINV